MKDRFKKAKFSSSYVYRPNILKFNRKSRSKDDSFKDVLEAYLTDTAEEIEEYSLNLPRGKKLSEFDHDKVG